MKNVLFLTARVPAPLDDGWKIRTFNLIQGYFRNGWQVDLLSFCAPGQSITDFPELRSLCRNLHLIPRNKAYTPFDLLRGLTLKKPFHMYNYRLQAMTEAAQNMISDHVYDLIQTEDIVMAQYLTGNMQKPFQILDMHNVESNLLQRYAQTESNLLKKVYAQVTASKLKRYENHVSSQFDQILVCSGEDKKIVEDNCHPRSIQVLPNGVDCHYFSPQPVDPDSRDLVFVGSMDYHANISGIKHFVQHILPLIHQKCPDAQLYIVGKNPPEDIQKLADEQITVTGMVPDVRDYLYRAKVVVVPLLVGGGTRLKILEAMACARPIVSTTLGAEGLEVKSEEHLLLADEPQDFASQVLKLLDDSKVCHELGQSALEFVSQRYEWSVITNTHCKQLHNLLQWSA